MKIATIVCRFLMGLGFVIFGLNILHPFLPQPPPAPGSLAAGFMAVFFPSHWMSFVGAFQLLGGLLVLSGRMAPLGLAILAPILVNILLFHFCLMNGEGIVPGLVFTVLEIFLIYAYRNYFRPLLSVDAKPS
jgi:putative oxidoreductase